MSIATRIKGRIDRYLNNTAQYYLRTASTYVDGRNSFPLKNPSWCNLSKRNCLTLKRMVDITAGIVGTAALIPVVLTITPLIQIMSWGPIFYYQEREGKAGKPIRVAKIRTMYVNTESITPKTGEDVLSFKLDKDPRIIPTGRPIRKFGLDEWPQFIPVLKGLMTFIGPRAKPANELDLAQLSLPPNWRDIRQQIAPGLIPVALVLKAGYPSDKEHAILETWYLANWSLGLDLKMIPRSLLVLAAGRHK